MFRYTYMDKQGALLCDVAQYVRKHNVVYKTPAKKAQNGLPLGNGFMGGLVFHSDRELCMRINRTDSFDYGPAEAFGAWGHEWEEKCTTLANCGVLRISDGTPAFAWEYLNEYDMTLDLGQGEINMVSETPISKWNVKGYGSLADRCLVWEVETSSEEPLTRTVSLERYGTRGFFHYYESFTRDTGRRLGNMTAEICDDAMLLTQKLNGTTFTTAVRVEGDGVHYRVNNQREVCAILPTAKKSSFRIYVTTTLSKTGSDTAKLALESLNGLGNRAEKMYRAHLDWWQEYWNRSFISIQNQFAEAVYYINRYQFASCGFGDFPPSVFGSLWTAFGDTRNWGHFYHWNDQMQFWPCDVWDHGELLKAYFKFRREMLPRAICDGRRVHGVNGAWYCDISDANGFQAVEPDTRGNMSCGAMIALQMYRHYKHFPDKAFLLEIAYPVMKACGDFYLGLLKQETDGSYHLHNVTAMEGYLYLDDTTTDWAMIRGLLKALLDVAEEAETPAELCGVWQDRLEHLYDPPTVVEAGKRIFAYGRYADGTPCVSSSYPEGDMGTSLMGTLLCVFPASLFDAWTKGPWQEIVTNTMERLKGKKAHIGWDILNQLYARFGYTEELERSLSDFLETYVIFPNGLTHFNPDDAEGDYRARVIPENTEHTDWGELHEKDKGERISYAADRFVHFYSEPEGAIATAINESLLQSHGDGIRVFPASGDGVFRLHAQGDYMVSAQKTDGKVRIVAIESRRGGRITIVSPFEALECVRHVMEEHPFQMEERDGQRRLSFETEPGECYVVFSKKDHVDGSYPTQIPCVVNQIPQKYGKRTIGLERDF